ncbi:hypothetical protein AB0I28_29885 [Phytomonospora sp. NPDC050363]|uniref:hypothetical protein n=1 Tax=Phytomonospora sp. NPDC050363 TaxID=3155642 RepID=UPI0033EA78A2
MNTRSPITTGDQHHHEEPAVDRQLVDDGDPWEYFLSAATDEARTEDRPSSELALI